MEIVCLGGKIALTLVYLSLSFMFVCNTFGFSTSDNIKTFVVACFFGGVAVGVASIIALVWTL